MLLVLRGTPAAVDEELNPYVRGISCGLAQGTKERWIEVGYPRKLVIEHRRAVGNGAVSLAKRTAVVAARIANSLRGAPIGDVGVDGEATVEETDAPEDAAEEEGAGSW